MGAGIYNLEIEQGADWTMTLDLKSDGEAVDAADWEFAAQIRRSYSATTATDLHFDLTDAASGRVAMYLSAEETAVLDGNGVWDVEYTVGSATYKLLRGKVAVVQEVTR